MKKEDETIRSLTHQRDAARRELCEFDARANAKHGLNIAPHQVAQCRGWDYLYPEEKICAALEKLGEAKGWTGEDTCEAGWFTELTRVIDGRNETRIFSTRIKNRADAIAEALMMVGQDPCDDGPWRVLGMRNGPWVKLADGGY